MKAIKAAQQGFTLIELMLAMTLTALLLGMLTAGMYTVVRDWQVDTSGLDETLDQSLVLLQLERALMAAFPHSYVDEEEVQRFVYFSGGPESLSWVSTVSPYRVEGLTAWRLESDARDGLRLRLAPAFSDNPDARLDTATTNPLLPNYTAQFRYLMQRNEEQKEWVEEWLGRDMQSLPRAVHVILTPVDEALGPPMEILAPIRSWEHEDIMPIDPAIADPGF